MTLEVVITEWALDAYLNLKHQKVFDRAYYWRTIRPDVELLSQFPTDPKFRSSKFWGPATDKSGNVIPDGLKMNWRQVVRVSCSSGSAWRSPRRRPTPRREPTSAGPT